MKQDFILQIKNINKSFGQNAVLRDVSFDVNRGDIVAFLGENGAGKSTLIKILAGIYTRDSGLLNFAGHGNIESAQTIKTRGMMPMAFIHQDLGLVDWMTITENMAFSLGYPKRFGLLINWKEAEECAKAALEKVGLNISPRSRVFTLTQAEKSIVAIARAIAVETKLLVLDEPTASLPANDVEQLHEILRGISAKGVGMIYVTHRLDEVLNVCNRIVILRDGLIVNNAPTGELSTTQMVEGIVGKKQIDTQYRAAPPPQTNPVVLAVDELETDDIGPISFELKKGEILAFAGLRGAGQEKLSRCLFGCLPKAAGNIAINGRKVTIASPHDAIKEGISLVAANRGTESLVPTMNVEENMFLNQENHGRSAWQLYSTAEFMARAQKYIELFHVNPTNAQSDILALSGGNQQKVVISRWLDISNDILILEDPTAGVDVGARGEIYAMFRKILAEGKSLIIVSSDFEEVQKIANRVLVFNKGKITAQLSEHEITHSAVFNYAAQ